MPREVLKYTPPWLSRPSSGFDLFQSGASQLSQPEPKSSVPQTPNRTIAARGTEVFVAVGKDIRWSDLLWIKDQWDDENLGRPNITTTADRSEQARYYKVRHLTRSKHNAA